MEKTEKVTEIEFVSYTESVPGILEMILVDEQLKDQETILLKPNLVNASPFPVTTPPQLVEAVIKYLRKHSSARLIIAEGCGDSVMDTREVFASLGYNELSKNMDVELLDLNHAPLVRLENKGNKIFPEMFLPEIAFESFIISLPVLKAHSLAVITGTLKNMMGFAPPKHYAGGGSWKKAAFHARMQQSVRELNSYLVPDFTLMDASVGLSQYHLGGPACDPPVKRLLAGYDPFELDQAGARLLGLDPDRIAHIFPM
ncbi:MAG TPA: DUF362 domain-containing protein [Desulfobacter sp.]|nr:DUF362 domain-containing protein [Desulfobacter sp.]